MSSYLDKAGLSHLWVKLKDYLSNNFQVKGSYASASHEHGWIDITDSCDFAVTVDKTSQYRSFVKYNPDTKEVKGVLYVSGTVTNQGRILTLPSSVSNSFRGLCGIAYTKSTSMLVTPRINGQIIYSSHTVNSSVTEVIYLIDFAT